MTCKEAIRFLIFWFVVLVVLLVWLVAKQEICADHEIHCTSKWFCKCLSFLVFDLVTRLVSGLVCSFCDGITFMVAFESVSARWTVRDSLYFSAFHRTKKVGQNNPKKSLNCRIGGANKGRKLALHSYTPLLSPAFGLDDGFGLSVESTYPKCQKLPKHIKSQNLSKTGSILKQAWLIRSLPNFPV